MMDTCWTELSNVLSTFFLRLVLRISTCFSLRSVLIYVCAIFKYSYRERHTLEKKNVGQDQVQILTDDIFYLYYLYI